MSEIERTVDRFYELISPQIFFEGWTDAEFIEWAELGDNIELRNLLMILEVHEKYEYCSIVKSILNQRNEKLSTVKISNRGNMGIQKR